MGSYKKNEQRYKKNMSFVAPNHTTMKRKSKDNLVDALLIKESEVYALKEVIDKWRRRAIESENRQCYYNNQLETIQAQYENEIAVIEEEYMHQLDEKDDIIYGLRQELHYFAGKANNNDSLEDLMDEFNNMSTAESVNDVEQDFTISRKNSEISFQEKIRSEDILDSIQNTVNAIENELRHQHSTKYRHSLSASTLIDSSDEKIHKKSKIPSFYNVFKGLPKMIKRHGKDKNHYSPITMSSSRNTLPTNI